MLLNPLKANADSLIAKKTLILSCSAAGDPVNTNAPGTYLEPDADGVAPIHPDDPALAPTPLILGDSAPVMAARPWSELTESTRSRMAFLHHGTYTNVHSNHPKVMRLMGGMKDNDMLVSFFAAQLAEALGTTQQEPLSVGANSSGELLSFQGRTLSNVTPVALKTALGESGMSNSNPGLLALRDQTVNELHDIYREHGTASQRRLLDRFVVTREEAASLDLTFLERLGDITGNGVESEIIAATVLAAMNVAPVITLHIPFGGDNHTDGGLRTEVAQNVSGVANLQALVDSVEEFGLSRRVMIGSFNVFGRKLLPQMSGSNIVGRDHNGLHHTTVLIGDDVRPGVYGGVERSGVDYAAQSIDSATGAGIPDGMGDIPHDQTMESVAKTMGCLLGISADEETTKIDGGKVIESVIAGS